VSGEAAATATLGAEAATKGTAEPARIDPNAVIVRTTGKMARLVRMIPPWHLQRSGSRNMA